MNELSLHVLDIAQNSVSANAKLIKILVKESVGDNLLSLEVIDDGDGMSDEFLKKVLDPFTTTRKTRKVGLGLPLLHSAAKQCNGDVKIESALGKGTRVRAYFQRDHIDRQPLGDMAATVSTLVSCNTQIDFVYEHTIDDKVFEFDTNKMRLILGDVPLNEPEVVVWMKEYLMEGITNIGGGVI